jgi:large conductance mechanosensitive channel
MNKILKEFQQFAKRGNVIDMAIGVIIGTAFGKIVTSLVNDIIMPPIGLLLGEIRFTNLFISLSGTEYELLEEAKKANVPTINYGIFINTVLDFLIIAVVVFLIVKKINLLKERYEKLSGQTQKEAVPAAPKTKECEYCLSEIPVKAVRCKFCTSILNS